MNNQEFARCIEMIRNDDPETYEQGYWTLIDDVQQFTNELIRLMQIETNPKIRGKFIELLGNSKDPNVIPLLVTELDHPENIVRYWAVLSLQFFGVREAEEIAEKYKSNHPEQWS